LGLPGSREPAAEIFFWDNLGCARPQSKGDTMKIKTKIKAGPCPGGLCFN
jgi:hypothetical protein